MIAMPGMNHPRPGEPRARFLVELARALGTYGTSSNRLEEVIAVCAHDLGLSAQTFNTPTSVFVSVENRDGNSTYLARIHPGEADLTKLMALDRLFNRVIINEISPVEGVAEIQRIVEAPPRYPSWMIVSCFGIVSGCAGHFLGGAVKEMMSSAIIGLVVGVLVMFTGKNREFSRLMEFLSGVFAAFIAGAMAVPFGGYMPAVSAIAGIIILLPGLTLTISMVELATKHVVSGTARLAGAIMVLMVTVFGLVLGQHLADAIFGAQAFVVSERLPWFVDIIAVLVATSCMSVLFQAHLRYAWVMVVAGMLSFFSARYGTLSFGPEIGVLGAAVVVGVASNLYARVFNRPALTMMLPGLLMLVPGSLGLRSLQLFMNNETVDGVQSTFTVFVVGVALVVGLLLSNVILAPRKVL